MTLKSNKFIKFLVTSGLCALIYIGSLFFLELKNEVSALANFILYSLIAVLNFLLSKYWTFESTQTISDSSWKFLVLILLGVVLNTVAIYTLSVGLKLPSYIAATIFLIAWSGMSFSLQKVWVFK